jgi:hypothetical protein
MKIEKYNVWLRGGFCPRFLRIPGFTDYFQSSFTLQQQPQTGEENRVAIDKQDANDWHTTRAHNCVLGYQQDRNQRANAIGFTLRACKHYTDAFNTVNAEMPL